MATTPMNIINYLPPENNNVIDVFQNCTDIKWYESECTVEFTGESSGCSFSYGGEPHFVVVDPSYAPEMYQPIPDEYFTIDQKNNYKVVEG
ncbi:hypothetical protein [Thermoactinomyces sp. CICC 10521]|uniref:hypothetical protein n=1 Tax=Thermoactinomyces sp. CICC 10521 TaxID=2767426 RepID=UPI0018DB352E|nr:hypothetical protein [Thermoactinomyces sp. CICC 10521]MBH8609434.1 hypothetical protein [Thermoactinomyces sp. CICC 10521]